MLTRRELLGAAGAGGSAALLLGCGGDGEGAGGGGDERIALDRKLAGSALELEYTLLAAYAAGAELLRGDARRGAQRIAEQEREHAARLTGEVRRLGGRPNLPKTPEEYARAFPRLRRQADVLRFAIDLENAAVRFYLESLPKLGDRDLRLLAAAIATNEAQHAAVLRAPLGRVQVPDAFVTGRSQAA